ncbi:unnamed protein product, partial [Symbiodinium necroappetens]
ADFSSRRCCHPSIAHAVTLGKISGGLFSLQWRGLGHVQRILQRTSEAVPSAC